MSDFWVGIGIGVVAGQLVAWWWRARGRWINWPTRFIPPPKVGRWQVWDVSPGFEEQHGRFRVRWTARVAAWSLGRRFPYGRQRFEVRRVRRGRA